jgi:hypothetical protein
MDLTGATVIPGLVGMHEHLFYPSGGGIPMYNEQAFSFPRLYLASGVTTARTGGSLEPYTDLNVKRLIDTGGMPGPKLDVTGPYLEGAGSFAAQIYELSGPDDATRTVDYWASEGVTSFKAYMNITRAELKAEVDAAHRHGIKITGHLCSVGFREAAAIGIDNLEHGLLVDTEFHPGKQPDVCPPQRDTRAEMASLDLDSAPVRDMIADLVQHNVAITSTLAVFEAFDGGRPPLEQRFLDALAPEAQVSYLGARARSQAGSFVPMLKKEMEFEYAFVKAGGLLMSGADPTGNTQSSQALNIILSNIDMAQGRRRPDLPGHRHADVRGAHAGGREPDRDRAPIREAVAEATRLGKLRPNSVDSLTGKNSGDNLGRRRR